MSDDEVMEILEKGGKRKSERYKALSGRFTYLAGELKRPGVTLELLWQEYKREHPEGYGYSLVPLSFSGMAQLISPDHAY